MPDDTPAGAGGIPEQPADPAVPAPAEGVAPSAPEPAPEPTPAAAAPESAPAPAPESAPVPEATPEIDPVAATADAADPFAGGADDPFGGLDQASIDELLKQASFDDPVMATAPVGGAGGMVDHHAGGGAAAAAAAAVAEIPGTSAMHLPDFHQVMADAQVSSIDLLRDVDLNVKIELGRSRMLVEDVLKLSEGSVVELDKLAGDPVDVFVNDRLVARGEVLVLNDNFCVRINEIVAGVKEEGL